MQTSVNFKKQPATRVNTKRPKTRVIVQHESDSDRDADNNISSEDDNDSATRQRSAIAKPASTETKSNSSSLVSPPPVSIATATVNKAANVNPPASTQKKSVPVTKHKTALNEKRDALQDLNKDVAFVSKLLHGNAVDGVESCAPEYAKSVKKLNDQSRLLLGVDLSSKMPQFKEAVQSHVNGDREHKLVHPSLAIDEQPTLFHDTHLQPIHLNMDVSKYAEKPFTFKSEDYGLNQTSAVLRNKLAIMCTLSKVDFPKHFYLQSICFKGSAGYGDVPLNAFVWAQHSLNLERTKAIWSMSDSMKRLSAYVNSISANQVSELRPLHSKGILSEITQPFTKKEGVNSTNFGTPLPNDSTAPGEASLYNNHLLSQLLRHQKDSAFSVEDLAHALFKYDFFDEFKTLVEGCNAAKKLKFNTSDKQVYFPLQDEKHATFACAYAINNLASFEKNEVKIHQNEDDRSILGITVPLRPVIEAMLRRHVQMVDTTPTRVTLGSDERDLKFIFFAPVGESAIKLPDSQFWISGKIVISGCVPLTRANKVDRPSVLIDEKPVTVNVSKELTPQELEMLEHNNSEDHDHDHENEEKEEK
jgi:hypothetical protein